MHPFALALSAVRNRPQSEGIPTPHVKGFLHNLSTIATFRYPIVRGRAWGVHVSSQRRAGMHMRTGRLDRLGKARRIIQN